MNDLRRKKSIVCGYIYYRKCIYFLNIESGFSVHFKICGLINCFVKFTGIRDWIIISKLNNKEFLNKQESPIQCCKYAQVHNENTKLNPILTQKSLKKWKFHFVKGVLPHVYVQLIKSVVVLILRNELSSRSILKNKKICKANLDEKKTLIIILKFIQINQK